MINIKGKEIKQLGIVVQNAEETAKNYWEMLGVGPWILIDFKPPHLTEVTPHGISNEVNLHIKAAIAQLGDLQIELLQPVKGPSTYMEFLKTRGQGIHHLSFDRIENHKDLGTIFEALKIDSNKRNTITA